MIGLDEVLADLHEVVDDKPDDFGYSAMLAQYGLDFAEELEAIDCMYFVPEEVWKDDEGDLAWQGVNVEQPCCIVGQVLAKRDMTDLSDTDNMVAFPNTDFAEEFTPEAVTVLKRVQRLQDLGMEWKRALAWTEASLRRPDLAKKLDEFLSVLDEEFAGMPSDEQGEHAATEMVIGGDRASQGA